MPIVEAPTVCVVKIKLLLVVGETLSEYTGRGCREEGLVEQVLIHSTGPPGSVSPDL